MNNNVSNRTIISRQLGSSFNLKQLAMHAYVVVLIVKQRCVKTSLATALTFFNMFSGHGNNSEDPPYPPTDIEQSYPAAAENKQPDSISNKISKGLPYTPSDLPYSPF